MTEPTFTMSRPELLNLLRSAHDEIIQLRRQVTALEPRAIAYDNINRIIGMMPAPSQGYGIDVAWQIKQVVETIVTERATEAKDEQHDG